MRWLTNRYLRALLALSGLGFIAYSLLNDGLPWSQLVNLSVARIAVALVTVVVAVVASAAAWSVLVEKSFISTGRVMLESLPAKYVPGGLGLPLSQISFETRNGDALGRTLSRMVQNFVVSISSGGAVAAVLQVIQGSGTSWQTPTAIGFALTLPLAHSALIERIPLPKRMRTTSFAPWRRVAVAFGITFLGLLMMGLGYQAVLSGMVGAEVATAGAFVLAWAIGFAVVPVPAGLGLRESALVAMLTPLPSSIVVLAAVVFRLLAVAAEITVAGVAYLMRFPSESTVQS